MNEQHNGVMARFARLIRGEEGTGDRIYNAESFLFHLAWNDPVLALGLAESVEENHLAWVDLTGVSPRTLAWVPGELRRVVASRRALVDATVGSPDPIPAAPARQLPTTLEVLQDCVEWLEALQDAGLAGPDLVASIVRARALLARERAR